MSTRATLSVAAAFVVLATAGCAACAGQALSLLFLRPLSRQWYRRAVAACTGAFLLCGSMLLERWAGIRVVSHGQPPPPNVPTFCFLNHASDVDMLVGLALLARYGFPAPGNAKAVVKSSLRYVPIFGWIIIFAEFLFLARSWKKDCVRLDAKLRDLLTFPFPLWFVLFPEGSRLTPQKLICSQDYARDAGYPKLTHVLLPRFKAFLAIVNAIRPCVEEICDVTIVFDGPAPSFLSVLSADSSTTIHAHLSRYRMSELPTDDAELEKWLIDVWCQKDRRIAASKADLNTLGPSCDHMFPTLGALPSLLPFCVLLICSASAYLSILYVCRYDPVVLRAFVICPVVALFFAAMLVLATLRPSSKGLPKPKSNSNLKQH